MTRSIINNPQPSPSPSPAPTEQPKPMTIEEYNGTPTRTLITVEVADVPSPKVREILAQVSKAHQGLNPTYVICTRNGKLTSDVFFEKEILDLVRELCEVRDGNIEFRTNAKDVKIIRNKL